MTRFVLQAVSVVSLIHSGVALSMQNDSPHYFALIPRPLLTAVLFAQDSSEEIVQKIKSLLFVSKWFSQLPYVDFCKEWEDTHRVSLVHDMVQHRFIVAGYLLIMNKSLALQPSRRYPPGNTVLMTAAQQGLKSIVRALYSAQNRPKLMYEKFFDTIYRLYCDDTGSMKQEINNYCGALNTDEHPTWITYLMYAIINKYYFLITYLLTHGAAVNGPDSDGNIPIHYALEDKKSVQLLLEHGADPNAKDAIERTPLSTVLENLGKIPASNDRHQQLTEIKLLLEQYREKTEL